MHQILSYKQLLSHNGLVSLLKFNSNNFCERSTAFIEKGKTLFGSIVSEMEHLPFLSIYEEKLIQACVEKIQFEYETNFNIDIRKKKRGWGWQKAPNLMIEESNLTFSFLKIMRKN